MKTFPMFLRMAGRRVVIAGGGEQAAQKTRLMLKTQAHIVVLADDLEPELATLAAQGRITQQKGPIGPDDFAHSALVFVATGCPAVDTCLHALAKASGAVVNVVDQPDLCDAITPSIVDRDPVVVAIGTEGTAPVLARQIKTQMESVLEPGLGDLAALAGRLRARAAARLGPRVRRDLWRWVFNDAPRKSHARGAVRETATMIKEAIETGEFGTTSGGSVSIVGAGPGASDLITLRGVQRLQEADVIYYDRLVDPAVLELARRDAERVLVGKAPGCHSWPQEKITQTLLAAAKRGQRVVRLKCGDPGIFARSCEELAALKAGGIPCEVVPGVTSACGAAAAAGEPLSERGEIDTVTLVTGHLKEGRHVPACLRNIAPGACVSVYMGVGGAAALAAFYEGKETAQALSVTVVAHAQTPQEIVFHTDIVSLPGMLRTHGIKNTAMITVKWRKSDAAYEKQPQERALPMPKPVLVASGM